MSNNEDDLDNDLDLENFEDGGGFDDPATRKNSFKEMWNNSAPVKIGVILAGFAVVVGALILFGGSKDKLPESQLSTASSVSEAPGTSEVSKTMQEAIQDKNAQQVEQALRSNGSAMPIPIEPAKGSLPVQSEDTPAEDPLDRWRKMQEERVRQQEAIKQSQPQQQAQQPQAPPVDTKTPAVNALAESMVSQMQAVLQNQTAPAPKVKRITSVAFLETLAQKQQAMQQQQAYGAGGAGNGGVNGTDSEQVENIILPAGTIEYGQLQLEANTDAPGPVMAVVVSGPLRNSRVIGSFQSTDQYLIISFNTIVIDGINYPIQAVAIDPKTTLPGVITEIDHRYFKRVILPAAAEFVTGLSNAISESGTTSVFINGSSVTQSTSDKNNRQEVATGFDAAGQKIGDLLNEEAGRTRPMLRVASGTPIGILFVQPVTDSNLERNY